MGRVMGWRLRIPVVDSFINESYTRAHYASLPRRSRINLAVLHGLERLTARWVDHVIANSETVRRTNAASVGIPLHKVSVLYRGRDPQPLLAPDPARQAALAATLPGMAGGPRLVNVARVIPRKGQRELVAAMPAVLARYPAAQLWIAGEGHLRAALAGAIAAARLEAHVYLLGTVEAVPELLALSELFVFPSHFEGLPGALIEAMLAGKPIVAVDTPVHRELITHGQSGWLVASRTPAALAAGIVYALDHPDQAAAWGRAAQADALARFSIDTVAARYAALYRALAKTP
jgi:glycosyltransferase involved in cell wall biosynthesis